MASEFDAADIAAQKRKNVVLESIEGLSSPNFFLGISAEGDPATPPSSRRLKRELERWLNGLDPDAVMAIVERGSDDVPKLRWEHDGWKVSFEALPKKPEARGKGQRTIGVQFGGARWVNSWQPMRDAVKHKGSRYGQLDRALLVAVNVESISLDRIDEMQALFGAETFVFDRNNLAAEPVMRVQHRPPQGGRLAVRAAHAQRRRVNVIV